MLGSPKTTPPHCTVATKRPLAKASRRVARAEAAASVLQPRCLSESTVSVVYSPFLFKDIMVIGSRLFMHSIIAEVSLVLAGACSLMEHPAEHQDEARASVWRTQCHREWVMKLPDAWQHRIEQWQYGAAGVKPTTLRALNMGPPHIVHQVLQTNRDPLALRPCNPLRGRTADGSFRTAAAKEYPVGLCRTLVLATLESLKYKISQFGTCTAADLSASESVWLNSLYMKACSASLSGKFLPDFQG